MADLTLTIEKLQERHPGLTVGVGESYTEAACVSLAKYHTSPPVTFTVLHKFDSHNGSLNFTLPDTRTQNAHANEIDATEAGAYGASLAAVESLSGLFAVRRAETLTGSDWYVAPKGKSFDDFEECIRLEVSGTGAGSSAEVLRRLEEKIVQTKKGQSNLPAIASVVGFKVLEIRVSPLEGMP